MDVKLPLPTGHAHHFLSRLDRVSRPQVELALSIYRDHELLRFILDRARLPERAPRIAISLEHPGRGPFLIVTREGRFVTCLGEGMNCGDIPVITRAQLDGSMALIADLRARDEARRRRFGEHGEVAVILGRILAAGDELSREDFVAVSSIAPLLRRELVALQLRQAADLQAARLNLLQLLRRTNKPHAAYREALRTFWNELWSVGHLAMLAGMNGPELVADTPELPWKGDTFCSLTAVDQGVTAVALQGIWGATKLGKAVLPGYKRALVETTCWPGLIDAVLSVTGLGLRHARLRAEARKALSSVRAVPASAGNESEAALAALLPTLATFAAQTFDDPEGCTRAQRTAGAAMLMEWTKLLPAGSAYRFERAEDVPEELALTVAAQSQAGFLQDVDVLAGLFAYLPWLTRAEPESFYLPAELLRAVRVRWTPEHTLSLLREQKHRAPRPAPRPEGPSRSGPCPCGSGKKYKRCCSGARREGPLDRAA